MERTLTSACSSLWRALKMDVSSARRDQLVFAEGLEGRTLLGLLSLSCSFRRRF